MPELLESVVEKETLPEGTESEIRILAQQERDAQERPNLLNNEVGRGLVLPLAGVAGMQEVQPWWLHHLQELCNCTAPWCECCSTWCVLQPRPGQVCLCWQLLDCC
jgi:hypothetical protein